MKPEDKRKYKKYAKNLLIAGYMAVILFLASFIMLLTFIDKIPYFLRVIMIITMILSIMSGLVLNFISDGYRKDLIYYMRNIREYRIQRNYCKALELIESGDLQGARKIFNNLMPSKHRYNDLLFVALIHEFKYSQDPELKEIGLRNINERIAYYNTNKINLFE